MAYDTPERIHYPLGTVLTTNAAATIATIKGPTGRSGHIVDIIGRVHTANHVHGTGTQTKLQVGVSGATTAMADWLVPEALIGVVLHASNSTGAVDPEYRLPGGTDILVNTVRNLTGSPTGSIDYTLVIDWH